MSLRICTVYTCTHGWYMVKNSIVVVMILNREVDIYWLLTLQICIGIRHLNCLFLQRWLTYFNRGSGFQKSSSRAATCYVISVISGARRGSSSDVDASSASAGISLAVTNSEPTDLASLASSTNKICWFWHTLKKHLKYVFYTSHYDGT